MGLVHGAPLRIETIRRGTGCVNAWGLGYELLQQKSAGKPQKVARAS
jgi:hypothetical protein